MGFGSHQPCEPNGRALFLYIPNPMSIYLSLTHCLIAKCTVSNMDWVGGCEPCEGCAGSDISKLKDLKVETKPSKIEIRLY